MDDPVPPWQIEGERCMLDTRLFRVRDARPLRAQALDGNEEIAVGTLPLAEIPGLIQRGQITHALVVAAFYHLHAEGQP